MKFLLSLILLSSLLQAEAPSILTINTGFGPPANRFVEAITQEAFLRADIGLRFQALPNKRSLINANSGIDDGDAARVWEINTYYPNLVRVPVFNSKIHLVALTNKRVSIGDPSDLSIYNVGVIHGMKIAVLMAEKAQPHSLFKATDYETLIRMLAAGRLDVVVINKAGMYRDLNMLKGLNLYLVDKPLMSRPLYLQLHKKNSEYIPQLTKAYQSIHDDGTYQKLYKQFYDSFEKQMKESVTIIQEKRENDAKR